MKSIRVQLPKTRDGEQYQLALIHTSLKIQNHVRLAPSPCLIHIRYHVARCHISKSLELPSGKQTYQDKPVKLLDIFSPLKKHGASFPAVALPMDI